MQPVVCFAATAATATTAAKVRSRIPGHRLQRRSSACYTSLCRSPARSSYRTCRYAHPGRPTTTVVPARAELDDSTAEAVLRAPARHKAAPRGRALLLALARLEEAPAVETAD
jgi:hypothetical protein